MQLYGILIACALALGAYLCTREEKRLGLPRDTGLDIVLYALPPAIIMARLYYVAFTWSSFKDDPLSILYFWQGGLAIYGAVIGGALGVWWLSRRKKISFAALTDAVAAPLLLGQAIGRWGNYFNQELYGGPTSLPWGIPIEPLNRPLQFLDDKFFHPAFLYESLGSFAVFVLMVYLHRRFLAGTKNGSDNRSVVRGAGFIALTYLITESLVRAGTELIRIDRVPTIADVRLPLLISIAIALAAGVALFMLMRRRSRAA